jgi:hypothetical protein
MELRLLSTEAEKRAFAHSLSQARTTRGAGFSETRRSLVGEAHLAFGRLYAVLDNEGPNPESMLAGFSIHDLATFPQTYPKPDLTHLPPEAVIECGELWAVAAGGARLARHAGWILAGILHAHALLVYPIFKPWNLSYMYKGFERVGDPIEWPYARTLDDGKIFVQAMVLEGEALARTIKEAGEFGFQAVDGERRIIFNSPFPICSKLTERRASDLDHPRPKRSARTREAA